MAPIAARLALRSLECVADIVGIEMLLAAQALDLSERGMQWEEGEQTVRIQPSKLAGRISLYRDRIRANIPFWEDDGVMHPALEIVGRMVRHGQVLGTKLRW